jgi:hypothetical protein
VTAVTTSSFIANGTLNPSVSATVGWHFSIAAEEPCASGFTTEFEPEVTGQAVKVATSVGFLQPNTLYKVCLVATNSFGEAFGNEEPVRTAGAVPVVESEAVLGTTPTTATFLGEINAENESTAFGVEYATNPLLEGATFKPGGSLPARLGGASTGPFIVTGLAPATTYFYRLTGSNETGTGEGAIQSFTTAGPPTAETGASSSPTRTTAMLFGAVNPGGSPTSYFFEYAAAASYEVAVAHGAADPYAAGSKTRRQVLGGARESMPVGPVQAEELKPGTIYHYALVAVNAAGTTVGADDTFETSSPLSPAVTGVGVTGIATGAATLAGIVDGKGLSTTYQFLLGASGEAPHPVATGTVAAGAGAVPVTAALTSLAAGTIYSTRLCVASVDASSCSVEFVFATLPNMAALTVPTTAPLLTAPTIAELQAGANTKPEVVPASTAQKLAKAIRACKRGSRSNRQRCVRRARRRFRRT